MDLIYSIKYLTQELYKDNNKLFYLNMLFLYSIEDRVYKDKGLHTYFKSVLKNPNINLYYLYSTTISNPKNVIFKSKLDKLKSDYLKIVEINDENLLSTIVPIHRIFYRLFVKGGAALKIFVDYLVKMDVIKTEEIPDIANNPTDIDTNLIVNPYFADSNTLNEYLKVLIKDVCLYLIVEYNELYNDIDEKFYTKLVRNESIVRDIKNFYPYRQGIELRLPSISNIQDVSFGNGNYSIKQEGCNVRLTYLNNSFEKISVFRLLLAMDIIDYKMNIQKIGDSEVGYPIEDIVLESSAELIDITFYNIDNVKINKIWDWAINTIEYGSNNTLFIGLHEYILDLIGMIDNVEKNPMLALKSEKRIQRRDFLYKLYCNYRLIQQIVENNSEINREHITLYCKNIIDKQYLTYELTQDEIDSIVPYIIGENPNNFEIILINFIKKNILENNSMLYKLDMTSSGHVKIVKYNSIINNIDPDSLLVIKNYINTVFNKLDINTKAKIFSNVVSIYNENQMNDKTTLLLYISIVKSCKDKPEELAIRISNNYKQHIRQSMNYYPGLFISDHIKTLYRKGSIQQITSQLLNENIAKMLIYVIRNIASDIPMNILILNKYPPFKIIFSSRFNFYMFLELMLINLNTYLESIGGIQYNIIYELIQETIISIYFRVHCNEKIGRNNFDGLSDLLFAKIIFSDIKHKDKMVKIFNINNKSLFFNNT
jgi:hypothetical protein